MARYPGALAAQIAWDGWRRKKSTRVSRQGAALSRVFGIGERVRDAVSVSVMSSAAPSSARKANTYRANRLPRAPLRGVRPHQLPGAAVDRSQYLPHSGARECARRVREAEEVA